MSDNLVLELLRAIRGDLARLNERLDDVDHCLSRIELLMRDFAAARWSRLT